jgi:mRNA-degrading endonuclease RelE of RelBE toxin-antitoxin system
MYEIRLAESVKDDLEQVPAHYRGIILDAIETHLSHNPDQETRRKKMLASLVPNFEAVPPVWQLRVGSYRVFYDVDAAEKIVYVRLVRKKPAHKTTEEIL